MGKRYTQLNAELKAFIAKQQMFFVATAEAQGRINLSPKGLDSLRLLDDTTALWRNLTGSGNETAAHLRTSPRMTLMFCAFSGEPMILRLYGSARVIQPGDAQWNDYITLFDDLPGPRQLILVNIDLVQTSCGFGVPQYEYLGQRTQLLEWAARKGEAGLREYQRRNNAISLDGKPTGIVDPARPQRF